MVSEADENAVKKRVRVGPAKDGRRGWMAPAKWREELGIGGWSDEEAKEKMAIKMDDGEELLGEVNGGGWFGAHKVGGGVANLRLKQLGLEESLSMEDGARRKRRCPRRNSAGEG